MNKNMLAVALASLLVGGVAVAAYNSFRSNDDDAADRFRRGRSAQPGLKAILPPMARSRAATLEYADVVNVKELTEKKPLYATVHR